ncbi:A-type flagellin [Streptococcus pneumoniae]|jgi:flagellin|nr:A-type flagellin [Streptococcus pneumoniae]
MALTVNTNIASLNTQRNINNSSNALTTESPQLS